VPVSSAASSSSSSSVPSSDFDLSAWFDPSHIFARSDFDSNLKDAQDSYLTFFRLVNLCVSFSLTHNMCYRHAYAHDEAKLDEILYHSTGQKKKLRTVPELKRSADEWFRRYL